MTKILFWLKGKKIIITVFFLTALFVTIYFNYNFYSFPKIVIWAWERPENLSFIKDKNIGVAFYAGSVFLTDSEAEIKLRANPLLINEETRLIPVVRIESAISSEFNEEQLFKTSDFIINTCSKSMISGCQIDFDAKVSEREFYKEVIKSVSRRIPKSIFLSITSLVFWCDKDSWLEDLKIKEAVPMFFDLGVDEYVIQNDFTGGSFMGARMCQNAIGVSIDEVLPNQKYFKNRRIYLFNPRSWTEQDFLSIINKIDSY